MIRLVCLDMDGVLTSWSNFWLRLHEAWGTAEDGKTLTAQYLHTDYRELMRRIIDPGGLWDGKDERVFEGLIASVPLSPGIDEFFAGLDSFTGPDGRRVPRAIISSGPLQLARRIQASHDVDKVFANELLFEDGTYRGRYRWDMHGGKEYKAMVLHHLCAEYGITPSAVLYVGDDRSDLEIFREVGVAIAFNAKDEGLRAAATHAVDERDLRAIVPIIERYAASQRPSP